MRGARHLADDRLGNLRDTGHHLDGLGMMRVRISGGIIRNALPRRDRVVVLCGPRRLGDVHGEDSENQQPDNATLERMRNGTI